MSTAIARTHNTKGVATLGAERRRTAELLGLGAERRRGAELYGMGAERRRTAELYGMGAERRRSAEMSGLGADPDLLAAMVANGYDPAILNTLVAMGATDAQLENLFLDGADPTTLMNQLGGALPPAGGNATQAGSYPQSAVPTTVSSVFGVYDLTQESSWAAMNSVFQNVKQQLESVARQFPGDADVAQHIQDFNSSVMQYAGYYQQLFGSAPSPIPLASTTGTLGALGVFPIVIVGGMVVALAAILGAAAVTLAWISWKKTQVPGQTATANAQNTQAQNASQLVTQYRAFIAAGDTAHAQQLLPALTAMGVNPNASTDWTTWFQNNMVLIFAGVAAIVVLPPLIKKL